ncbi:hypothetical protein RLIN73S_04982 [Rhodanobacter lindaniclasticus]
MSTTRCDPCLRREDGKAVLSCKMPAPWQASSNPPGVIPAKAGTAPDLSTHGRRRPTTQNPPPRRPQTTERVQCAAVVPRHSHGTELHHLQGRTADQRHGSALRRDPCADPGAPPLGNRGAPDGAVAGVRPARRRAAGVRQGAQRRGRAGTVAQGVYRRDRTVDRLGQPHEARIRKACGRARQGRCSTTAATPRTSGGTGTPVRWPGTGTSLRWTSPPPPSPSWSPCCSVACALHASSYGQLQLMNDADAVAVDPVRRMAPAETVAYFHPHLSALVIPCAGSRP